MQKTPAEKAGVFFYPRKIVRSPKVQLLVAPLDALRRRSV